MYIINLTIKYSTKRLGAGFAQYYIGISNSTNGKVNTIECMIPQNLPSFL